MALQPETRTIILPLAVAETIIWACIFYAFPALLLEWENSTTWSKTGISGAFSAALLSSAVMAPVAGRMIDRGLAKVLFTGSTLAAGLLLLVLSQVQTLWQFYLVWVGIGVCMAGCLYEPCFAVLTRALGSSARRGITTLTLIAGFAGTVSFPLLNALAELGGWRLASGVAGALMLATAPWLVWRATTAAESGTELTRSVVGTPESVPYRVFRNPVFWLLGLSFASIALTHGLLLTHILPLLDERGVHREAAILAASMIGPMQVAGRLAMASVERRVSTYAVAQASFVVMGIAGLCLLGLVLQPALLVLFVVLYGSAYGVTSITRPVVIGEFMGQRDYGVIAGFLATLYLLVVALSPTLASLLWSRFDYDAVIVLACLATLFGLICLRVANRVRG